MFDHTFPEGPEGESVGVTSVLTALSSAVESTAWSSGPQVAVTMEAAVHDAGPLHDLAVLEALAEEITEESGCSWSPRDYWNCTTAVADALWEWIQRWGHQVLEILAKTPSQVGVGAAATNAAWYAIEGDYDEAGLALATALPYLPFTTSPKVGATAQRAADGIGQVARLANKYREAVDEQPSED